LTSNAVVDAARELIPALVERPPAVVVTEPFAQPAMLAAEAAGSKTASLIPDPHHVVPAGYPVFASGLMPPRTPVGRTAWRLVWPLAERARRRVRSIHNEMRHELGLPAVARIDGSVSDELAMVATFPQLEYPRRLPEGAHVTGPMQTELRDAEPNLPGGEGPLVVVVASTTGFDADATLIRATLDGLADEPVRVVASLSNPGTAWPDPTPANATVVDWLALPRVLPEAAALVSPGGHGTVSAGLAAGVPVLASPIGGNTAHTGVRLAWSGAGELLPGRLLSPATLRLAVRRLLGDRRFAARAAEIAEWARRHDGPDRGAELVERYARR
jgi:UDP:flavonoid glycosyltransferase YjiC (YdhE family)